MFSEKSLGEGGGGKGGGGLIYGQVHGDFSAYNCLRSHCRCHRRCLKGTSAVETN